MVATGSMRSGVPSRSRRRVHGRCRPVTREALSLQLYPQIVRIAADGERIVRGDDLRLDVLEEGLVEGLHLVEGDRILDGLAEGADLAVLDQLLDQRSVDHDLLDSHAARPVGPLQEA